MPVLDDLLALVPSANATQPRFIASLSAAAAPALDAAQVAAGLAQAFDLDAAIGAQLDVVGLWVGVSRQVSTPLAGVYLAFDTPGLGWDQGAWRGPYDPDAGLVSLADDQYRALIRARIVANHWDGTLAGASAILSGVFGASSVFLEDRQDMTMIVGLSGTLPDAVTLALLTGGHIPLKPAGVRVIYAITTVQGAPVFGFDVDNGLVGGFDHGAWASSAPAAPYVTLGYFYLDESLLAP